MSSKPSSPTESRGRWGQPTTAPSSWNSVARLWTNGRTTLSGCAQVSTPLPNECRPDALHQGWVRRRRDDAVDLWQEDSRFDVLACSSSRCPSRCGKQPSMCQGTRLLKTGSDDRSERMSVRQCINKPFAEQDCLPTGKSTNEKVMQSTPMPCMTGGRNLGI